MMIATFLYTRGDCGSLITDPSPRSHSSINFIGKEKSTMGDGWEREEKRRF
jgi:hypothetical protein